MTCEEAILIYTNIKEGYEKVPYPKYKNSDMEYLEANLNRLSCIKGYLHDNKGFKDLVNSISQAISMLKRSSAPSTWRITSERGINKTIQPLVKKKGSNIMLPYGWIDKYQNRGFIDKGFWGAKNYMVMDTLGIILLFKEGGDTIPKIESPIFRDMDSIIRMESELLELGMPKESHSIQFDDRDFRKFTGCDLSSDEILKLLRETSQVEFKLVFPVRLKDENNKTQEKSFTMNYFSRLFDFGFSDARTRNDGIVQFRKYHVIFNTILGQLFAHNLLTRNYDWVDNSFYKLPIIAQIFYRRFLLHIDFPKITISLSLIKEKVGLKDKNITNLLRTINNSIFMPLKEHGLITAYEMDGALIDKLKFVVTREKKGKKKNNSGSIKSG